MKILVCIKQVPESNKVEVDPVTGVLKRDGAASKMNPYDLYALETAFRTGDQGSVCDGSGCGNTFVRPQIRRSRCAGYELYAGTGDQSER